MGAWFTSPPTPAKGHQELPVVPWHTLPQEALVNVFRYLKDGDRCKMSLACKAWHRIFKMACLWRRRHFVFRGKKDHKTRQVRYDVFFREHGQHVQHVILEFAWPDIDVVQSFQTFVAKANECAALRLLSIKVRHLNLDLHRRGWSGYRTKIVRALCLLLKRQPMLQEADLFFCQFTRHEGLRVLKALTGDLRSTTRRNLISLNLEEFFEPRTRSVSLMNFPEIMGRFPALAFLCLDQHYLCEAVLDNLITSCAQTLRHLDIVMDEPVVHAIDSHTWWLAVQRCPSLTVTVRLEEAFTFEEYSRVLVASMPLTRVSLQDMGVMGDIIFTDVARFLEHVSDIFFNTIEEVRVDLEADVYLEVDEAVVKLIESCLRLKRLFLSLPLEPETLDKLASVLAARPKNEMERLKVQVSNLLIPPGYIQKRWPALCALGLYERSYDNMNFSKE